MSIAVRLLLRYGLLFLSEEWVKAKIDMYAAQNVHAVEALCATELAIFRKALAGLDQLHREAARAAARFPAAKELIVEMLEQRMHQLSHSVNEAAAQSRKVA